MESKNNVKGTRDILPSETEGFIKIESVLRTIASLYSYHEIRTPILEYSEVFARGVGEGSDIVRKEMYTFLDKGERSVTMRPEFTAGIIRSVIQNKLYATNELPLKLYYVGPAFRYERPQLGRYRQFTQFGVESVGNNNVYNDFEVISMAYSMLYSLGLTEVKVKINCLGDNETRTSYREALKAYFKPHLASMCEDCKQRYELNPLRILDCKVPEDHLLAKDAPKINDYLSASSKERFDALINALKESEIPFEIDDQLVRGLDYYSETVFEFHYVSKKGNNYGAIGAGGHYSHLLKELDGPDMPGIGFSFGVERLYSVLKDDELLPTNIENPLMFYVMPLDKSVWAYAHNVATIIRLCGYRTDLCFDQIKLGNMFKRATKKGAKYAIIIGEDEKNNEEVVLKNLASGEQRNIQLSLLEDVIDELNEENETECCEDCED